MILFCGIPSETPLAVAIAAAEAAGLPYAIFNQRNSSFSDMVLDYQEGRWGGCLWTQETAWPLEGFTGIYTRLIDYRTLPENQPRGGKQADAGQLAHSAFLESMLSEWIEIAPCRVLNKAEAMASNGSKPYQAQWIQRAGFLTPPTLITNEPDLARDFVREHKRVIYKSTSSVRSIVRELDSTQADLFRIRSLPTQFQARIIGTNIRVHVIGEKVFAAEILSQAVDYRYAERDGYEIQMQPLDLPNEIADRCIKLSKMLRLEFTGIDLLRTLGGEYYCFEVNPSPAYSYFEHETGQPISRAVVDYLSLNDS